MSIKQRWHKFKPLPEDIRGRLGELNSLFEQEEVLLAYLFGSLVRGKGNDVDMAALVDRDNLSRLREKLWEVLGTQRLDLVNLRTASPLLRFEVISTGVLVYKKNDDIENAFEMATIREYKDTAHLRKKQSLTLKERMQEWS
jgi:predicted nucleotidyltransferase